MIIHLNKNINQKNKKIINYLFKSINGKIDIKPPKKVNRKNFKILEILWNHKEKV